MKRVLSILTAASGLSLAVATVADAQSLGGFPIREPGGAGASTGAGQGQGPAGSRNEIIVSQDEGSRYKTVAAAMRDVKPGGTIIVKGGVYDENIDVTKPVEIRGVIGDYRRPVVFRPAPNKPCINIRPSSPVASVAITQLAFEFSSAASGAACVNVEGGTVSVSDTFIVPKDSDIPLRAAYGTARPDLVQHLAYPPRDLPADAKEAARLDGLMRRHASPVGADQSRWNFLTGGTNLENMLHAKADASHGLPVGPAAGVRVVAGDVRLNGNVIVGARTAVEFVSADSAFIQGQVTDNVMIGNGVGIAAAGMAADLLVARNTIRYNSAEGVKADVYDGVKIISNEISGNGAGIFLSEKVRMATINSNVVYGNLSDAMRVSSGFFGLVGANTFADNRGCTIQFFSAEKKYLTGEDVKITPIRDFVPRIQYDGSNVAENNNGDAGKPKKKKRGKAVNAGLPYSTCDAPLTKIDQIRY